MTAFFVFGGSFVFVMSVLALASLLHRRGHVSAETSRKWIHIGVAHWVLFVPYLQPLWLAMIAPLSFVGLNYLSHRYQWLKSMERADVSDYGTVYYAVALSVITYVSVVYDLYLYGAVAMLVLGWGDGLAALVGRLRPSALFLANKSLSGTMAMFAASGVVSWVLLQDVLLALLIAITATISEAVTPKGFDNLSIPLLVFGVLWLVG
jgi:phytol kinase